MQINTNWFVALGMLALGLAANAVYRRLRHYLEAKRQNLKSPPGVTAHAAQLRASEESIVRAAAMIEARENERRRFAREIHDGLGQILAGIKFGLAAFQPIICAAGAEPAKKFMNLQEQLDTAIAESKRIALNRRPKALEELGILPALELLCRQVSQQSGMPVKFFPGQQNGRLPANLEMALYRIVQEALNNIVKHAEAKAAAVHLVPHPASILMIIEDNGKGFATAEIKKNGYNGMMNMYERAQALNGRLGIDSQPGHGTKVYVELPL